MPTDYLWTHLLLFDGVCNLCDHTVQWVLTHDQRGIVSFCSIQSEVGSQLYLKHGFDPSEPKSMMLITPQGCFVKSDAVIHLAILMGGRMAWLAVFKFIPRSIRDLAYSFIATNRYRFFGRKDACMVPQPEWMGRFV